MGGGGTFALCLGADFLECSTGQCSTFASPPLAQSELFECVEVEVWGLQPPDFSHNCSGGFTDAVQTASVDAAAARAATLVEESGAEHTDQSISVKGKKLVRKPTAWF